MTGVSAPSFDLARWLDDQRRDVEAALRRALDARADLLPAGPVRDAVRHGVLGGGKRIRPALLAAAYRACGGGAPDARVHDLAASVELIHAYSLMHDDLPCMDDAPLRRGRPTTHRVHGEAATTRSGAALIPLAILHAHEAARGLGCPDGRAREVARELARAAGADGMVGGQTLDLLGEGRALEAAELERLHRLKTGALLAASLRMGGVAAGAGASELEALDGYGRAIGLAFQIADDVLDATATAERLGKEPSDTEMSKSTYVSLYGVDEARRLAGEEARRARALLEDAGIASEALRALASYVVDRRR